MRQLYEFLSKAIYCAIAVALMLLAFALVAISLWSIGTGALLGTVGVFHVLHSVGLIIVSVAIFDVGKFFIEEEVLRERELRSIREARQSLTKFMTIIIIAVSLETLVLVFETKQEQGKSLLYPVALLMSVPLMLVGLSAFQWLSSKADALRPWDSEEAEQEAKRQE